MPASGFVCILCRFEVEPDDARNVTPSGRCICERCWHYHVGDAKELPRELRREMERLLRELPEV